MALRTNPSLPAASLAVRTAMTALLIFLPGMRQTLYGQAQHYIFRHINTANGLANDNVQSIIQDSKGFMWLATDNGLQRYDGYIFTTYHHDPAVPQSLGSDHPGFLLRAPDQNILVLGSSPGGELFDPATGNCRKIPGAADPMFQSVGDYISACKDNQGNIWLLGINTLREYDIHLHKIISFEQALPKSNDRGFTRTILCDPSTNNIWFNSTYYGVCMYDPVKNIFSCRSHNPANLAVFSIPEGVGTLFIDKNAQLWVNTYNGRLFSYSLGSHKLKRYFLNTDKGPAIFTNCFLQDRKGTIWAGSMDYGLLQYSRQADSFLVVPRNLNEPGELAYNESIFCLFEDKDGNIWVGTDKGVNIFNPYHQQFISISDHRDEFPIPRRYPTLSFLETNDGELWSATYGKGIQVFDKDWTMKKKISYDPSRPWSLKDPGNRVWSLISQQDGKIWAGCQHGWLSIYDPRTKKFISSQPEGLGKKTIIRMVRDKGGVTWLALYAGIARWNEPAKTFTTYNHFLPYKGNYVSQANDIETGDPHALWVATLTNGLQRFDPVTGRFTKIYVPETDLSPSLSSNDVTCITRLNDSLLALGTDAGINLFNTHTERFSYLNSGNGLPSNYVTALFFHAPDLWIATGQGICKINMLSRHVTNYGPEDGILSNDFGDCEQFYRMLDGRLLAGYKGGFICFNPDSLVSNPPPAEPVLTGCKINEIPVPIDSILALSDTLSLSYSQNFITIQYASLHYLEAGHTSYYYLLEGLDKNWIKAGDQQFASYTNLPPGTYRFRVKCENRDGIPCRKETTLTLIVHPPFWLTWWFELLLLAAVLLLIYGLYRYRIGQLLQLQKVRNEISKDIHDDVGAALSSISILSEVAKNKLETGQQDQTYSLLTKISAYSHETVENMGDLAWSIRSRNDRVDNIIQRLQDFGQETCSAKEIELQFHADEKTTRTILPIKLRKNCYLICKEAVNNAIRHGECRLISVSFSLRPAALEVRIEDDGKGFGPDPIKNGNGLINMRSRVDEMKGRMDIVSDRNGTRLILLLPLT